MAGAGGAWRHERLGCDTRVLEVWGLAISMGQGKARGCPRWEFTAGMDVVKASMRSCACMVQLTIRGVSEDLDRRLKELARERGESVNATVLQVLQAGAGGPGRRQALARYVTWTETDLAEFEDALGAQRQVDDQSWR